MGIWTVVIRTGLLYFAVLIIFRLMGKREIGKLSVFDLVISIMIADIAVLVIDGTKRPLFEEFAPIIVLFIIQIVLAFVTLKIPNARKLFDGSPSIIIANGELQQEVMKKQRYNFDDLMLQLRGHGIDNINEVTYAILEPSGGLSIFKADDQQHSLQRDAVLQEPLKYKFTALPLPLIIEGKVQDQNLQSIDKTRFWLNNQLQQQGIKNYKQVFFCSINHRGYLYISGNFNKNINEEISSQKNVNSRRMEMKQPPCSKK